MAVIAKGRPRAHDLPRIKITRIWHRRLRDPLLTVMLALQAVILFILPAVRSAGLSIPHVTVYAILMTFVMLACVLSRSRGAIAMMVVSVMLTTAGGIWQHEKPDLLTVGVSAAGQVLAQLTLLWIVSAAVFGAGPVTHHRILGAVVMYLSIGMIFTSLYILVARSIPMSFNHLPSGAFDLRETMTYFSFGTLTTCGFGEIFPVHPVARSLANVEAVCGQLFPATLLARIVGLHSSRPRAPRSPTE